MNQELAYTLGGFSRYMNRPLAKVHVYTWKLANELQADCPSIRLLRPYRDEVNKEFRWRLAQWLKARRYAGRIALPHYNEATANYIHSKP